GSPITTGFTEFGSGMYQWTGAVPDGQRGSVVFSKVVGGVVTALVAGALSPSPTMSLDMAQAIPDANAPNTLGDALSTVRAKTLSDVLDSRAASLHPEGYGTWILNGATLTLYRKDGVTVAKTMHLPT